MTPVTPNCDSVPPFVPHIFSLTQCTPGPSLTFCISRFPQCPPFPFMGDPLSLPWTPGPLLISCIMCPQASPGVPFSFLLLPNFPGFSRSHENPSPSTPGTWDPHAIPVSGLSLPLPRLNPSVSLLWGLPAYSQLSNSFRILRVLQALLCTTWDTPPQTHTHTHLLCTRSSCPSSPTSGVSSPTLEPLPVCLGPPQHPLPRASRGPLSPSPYSIAKPPSPWPLFTRTRAS